MHRRFEETSLVEQRVKGAYKAKQQGEQRLLVSPRLPERRRVVKTEELWDAAEGARAGGDSEHEDEAPGEDHERAEAALPRVRVQQHVELERRQAGLEPQERKQKLHARQRSRLPELQTQQLHRLLRGQQVPEEKGFKCHQEVPQPGQAYCFQDFAHLGLNGQSKENCPDSQELVLAPYFFQAAAGGEPEGAPQLHLILPQVRPRRQFLLRLLPQLRPRQQNQPRHPQGL